MTRTLKISADLALPLDAQTRTTVIYGGKGKGKTNCGAVLCEEFARNGLRFAVIDPLDVWWGLRHGADRNSEGIDVVILGGTRGDLPIAPDAGAVVADFVADENANTIVVMRRASGEMWTAGERIRFMRDFARRLFARQGEARQPIHLVIDEAGRFVPQQMPKGTSDSMPIAECVGAIEELVEWGRNCGIGVTLITQRSARMNKSVSELAECMIAFQTAGPHSIAAIVDWFGDHVAKERQRELVERLRQLPVGRALIVSPEWLAFEGEAQIRKRQTFDSSATPKPGARPARPGKAKAINLDAYRAKLAETVERAKAADPRELTKRIRDLEGQLAKAAKATPAPAAAPDPKAVDRLTERLTRQIVAGFQQTARGLAKRIVAMRPDLDRLTASRDRLMREQAEIHTRLAEALASLEADVPRLVNGAPAFDGTGERIMGRGPSTGLRTGETLVERYVPVEAGPAPMYRAKDYPLTRVAPAPRASTNGATPDGWTPQHDRILTALAEMRAIGIDPASRQQLRLFAAYDVTSGKGGMKLAQLIESGHVVLTSPGFVSLVHGAEAAAPPSLADLHQRVMNVLDDRKRALLAILIDRYPDPISRADLRQVAQYDVTSGKGGMKLGQLVALGVVDIPKPGHVVASPLLFPRGLT